MAKDTAKKNWKKNVARMSVFSYITIAVNVVYLLAILYRNGGLPSFADLVAIVFWAGQEYFALGSLKAFAKPTFSPEGDLLDCADASNPKELGYYSFAQDILWVCWVVQVLCIIHPAFFVFYLPVPATIIYKIWGSVLRPLLASHFSGPRGAEGGDEQGSGDGARSRQDRRREEVKQRKMLRRS